MGDCLRAGIPSRSVTSQLGKHSMASLRVAKSSTSFGWGKGENVTSAGWQVTLCDPIWHVSSRCDEASWKLLYSVPTYHLLTSLAALCSENGCINTPRRFLLVLLVWALLCC